MKILITFYARILFFSLPNVTDTDGVHHAGCRSTGSVQSRAGQ